MTSTDQFLAVALACVARGWPVVPLRPGTKKPAFHGYDRCPRTGPCIDGHRTWEQRSIGDPDQARWYWTSPRGRVCNVGIATGPADLVVIDLDVPKPDDDPRPVEWARPDVTCGEDAFLIVCDRAGQIPPTDTYTVATPSGGWHLYYRAPEGVRLGNTGGARGKGLGWKIDTRTWGGQVVAPGSIIDGRAYRTVLDVDPIPLPMWLVERLAAPPPAPPRPTAHIGQRSAYLEAAKKAECAAVRAATVNRNAALYGAAVALGRFVASGDLSEREHAEALMDAASRHIGIGAYSARQAAQTIASGLRNALQRQVA